MKLALPPIMDLFKSNKATTVQFSVGKDTLDSKEDLKEYIVEKKKVPEVNPYRYTYSYYNNKERKNERTVYFYEFSDLSRVPLVFKTVDEFCKWAYDHGVEVTSYSEGVMRETPINYVACFHGKQYICAREKWADLDKAINWKNYQTRSTNDYEF